MSQQQSTPASQGSPGQSSPPPMPTAAVPPVAQPLEYRSPNLEPVQRDSTPYEQVADKLGMVPTLRASDNLISLGGLLSGGLLGAAGGLVVGGPVTAVGVGVLGGFAGVILTGLYLAIRNLFRK